MLLDSVLKTKVKNVVWTCNVCFHDLHSEQSIICEACLQWSHFWCIGLKTQPKAIGTGFADPAMLMSNSSDTPLAYSYKLVIM